MKEIIMSYTGPSQIYYLIGLVNDLKRMPNSRESQRARQRIYKHLIRHNVPKDKADALCFGKQTENKPSLN